MTRSVVDGAAALADALRAHGGALAEALGEYEPGAGVASAGPAQIAACGPRTAGHEAEYELLLEMIREGALLHYGSPRIVRPGDPDLGLLLGDELYALGLSRLAELGDVAAVAELADVISLIAQAAAAGDEELADAIWLAGAIAIGWGSGPAHEAAKAAARAENPRAAGMLRAAAEAARAGRAGGGSSDCRLDVDDTLTSAFNLEP